MPKRAHCILKWEKDQRNQLIRLLCPYEVLETLIEPFRALYRPCRFLRPEIEGLRWQTHRRPDAQIDRQTIKKERQTSRQTDRQPRQSLGFRVYGLGFVV